MKRIILIILPLIAGCSSSPEFTERFEAERDLWSANRDFQKLTIAPQLVGEEQWKEAAVRYEELGDLYAQVPASSDTSRLGREIRTTRTLAAQAYNRAAEVRMSLRDAEGALDIYAGIEEQFSDLPGIAAGAALSLGQLHEQLRNREEALAAYDRVFGAIEGAGDQAIPSTMMQVPLRIARLETGEASEQAYARSREFYKKILQEKPNSLEGITAQSRLIDAATDNRDWPLAILGLKELETALLALENPPQEPAQVRMAIGQTQYMGQKATDEAVATWESLLKDYPNSEVAPRALIALSNHFALEGKPDTALELLSRVPQEYSNDLVTGPVAVLAQARLLEREDRWTEAIQVYKRLPIDYPLSEAALQSYIDVIGHYERAEDEAATEQALRDAHKALTGFLERYPSTENELAARQRLVFVYFRQDRFAEGVEELLVLRRARAGTPAGLQFLLLAAQITETKLEKLERAAELFEEISRNYPETETAKLAGAEAERIRKSL